MDLVWLVPLLPLLGFIIIGLGNKKLSNTLVSIIGCGVLLLSFIIVLTELIPFINGTHTEEIVKKGFDWITVGNFKINFSFQIDQLSVWMMTIITGVGFLIHLYSAGYMSHDEGFARYFAFLNLFVFSMLLLVMGSNYVVMFAGWEGVGLCSYLLIGFWFKNQDYNNAAKKAFIMNRIGDLGFLLGMFLIFVTFNSLEFTEVFAQASNPESVVKPGSVLITAITLLLFIGATGKSAQIPLYTWLPDAMAGPTPVSALIHAATMVTAGIYMIVRSNALYVLAPFTNEIIMIVGLVTALFAATIGLVQNDIKKVLAYSTVSQLGYMFFALGLGAYNTALFHVTTHAFFKALLFLGAGSVIHAMSGEQDIRMMGGLAKKLPITFITFLIGTLAISGIPPFAGFFSKDEILANAFHHSPVLFGFALVGALMTTFYMFRLLFLTFFGTFRGTEHQKSHLHESPLIMTIPLMILAALSVVGGFLGLPKEWGGNFIEHFLSPLLKHIPQHEFNMALVGISTGAVVAVIIITWVVYVKNATLPPKENAEVSTPYKVLYNKYYIDEIYAALFVKPVKWLSDKFYSILELRVIDSFVNAWGKGVNRGSAALRFIQTGSISFYLLIMVVGIILILFLNGLI
jgi:NADH-quinone oxidoreductase subunit L